MHFFVAAGGAVGGGWPRWVDWVDWVLWVVP